MNRKSSKNTRGPNQDEKDFQWWLKNQRCIVSGQDGVSVHHCKGSTFKHNKVLVGHWFCIPLSYDEHQGPNGYHSGSKPWIERNGAQSELWARMAFRYPKQDKIPDDVKAAIIDYSN
jgi:hypothetical protein